VKLGLNFTDNGNRYEIETTLGLNFTDNGNRYEIETTLGHNFTENYYSEHISSSPHTQMQKKRNKLQQPIEYKQQQWIQDKFLVGAEKNNLMNCCNT